MAKPKNTICLWFDKDAEDAARFYTATFPDSQMGAVSRAPADYRRWHSVPGFEWRSCVHT